jgi:predicted RNase H-like nuclease (RuvC/YqgF family)
VICSYFAAHSTTAGRENETDSGCQLLSKIEDQEKLLDWQQAELDTLRNRLEARAVYADQEEQIQLLRRDLQRKSKEVKALWNSITQLQELLWQKHFTR